MILMKMTCVSPLLLKLGFHTVLTACPASPSTVPRGLLSAQLSWWEAQRSGYLGNDRGIHLILWEFIYMRNGLPVRFSEWWALGHRLFCPLFTGVLGNECFPSPSAYEWVTTARTHPALGQHCTLSLVSSWGIAMGALICVCSLGSPRNKIVFSP